MSTDKNQIIQKMQAELDETRDRLKKALSVEGITEATIKLQQAEAERDELKAAFKSFITEMNSTNQVTRKMALVLAKNSLKKISDETL